MINYWWIFLWSSLLLLSACQNKKVADTDNERITRPRHATFFYIEKADAYTQLTILDPWKKGEVLVQYNLVPRDKDLPENLPAGEVIRVPLEQTAVFPTVICSFMNELGVISTLSGVAESQYIQIPEVQEKIRDGRITDVGFASNPDVEKLMMANPEVIFANTMSDAGHGQIGKTNIPVIECVEYMENTPLGQAEWIRFIGLLFDREAEADSLFAKVEAEYLAMKRRASEVSSRPTVFTELLYSGVWYVPGGNSYIANLIADAGGEYCWEKDNEHTGSINLSFEQVLDKAEKADYWLFKYYNPHSMTYRDLLSSHDNYKLFQAFQKQNVYACNTYTEPYYEQLPIHPEQVLKDLIRIFHPELLPGYEPKFYKSLTSD